MRIAKCIHTVLQILVLLGQLSDVLGVDGTEALLGLLTLRDSKERAMHHQPSASDNSSRTSDLPDFQIHGSASLPWEPHFATGFPRSPKRTW
jgi:hypothetical protein